MISPLFRKLLLLLGTVAILILLSCNKAPDIESTSTATDPPAIDSIHEKLMISEANVHSWTLNLKDIPLYIPNSMLSLIGKLN